jgi:uncharacterized membrane protein YphA (DoxX/SURF4 family)
MFRTLARTHAPPATILIRILVGAVFLSEGIQKFLFAEELGAGRFTRIGLPNPEVLGPMVGAVEVVCGSLVLAGLCTRLAVVPLLVIMSVALATTKWPLLAERGFWHMAHEARTDLSMTLGSLYLLIVGAGRLSLDTWIWSSRR